MTLRQRMARWLAGPAPVAQRSFAAARIDNLTSGWLATEKSLNEELRSDLNRLRSRGRDLVNNNDYARKFRGMVQNNIVGPNGIRLQARVADKPGQPDRMANAAIEAAWADWCAGCDITGHMTLRDLCENLVGSLPSDGEFLVRMVRGTEAGNRHNFALQVIDVDRIDTMHNVAATRTTNAVVMGVEVNAYRRPIALHLFASHPGDGVHSGRERIRVPVDDLVHRFKVERAEQLRGVPWMAPGMLSLHHLGAFKLAALLAAENGANHYGFFETPDGEPPIGAQAADGKTITTTQPGVYDTLPLGVKFQPHESKYPTEAFGPFVKTTLQRIASGWGVAYHSLANDLEGVSFSSIRSGTLEERDRWAADQEWFISAFMEPVYTAWLQMALLSGSIVMPNGSALPPSKMAKFSAHEWQARRWDWVDPRNDMEAKILSVKSGLIAPQDLSAAMGYDFDDTLAKIKAAQELAAASGITLAAYEPTTTQAAKPEEPNQETPKQEALKQDDKADARHVEVLDKLSKAVDREEMTTIVESAIAPFKRAVAAIEDREAKREKQLDFAAMLAAIGEKWLAAIKESKPVINVQQAPAPTVRAEINLPQPAPTATRTVIEERDADGLIVATRTEPI